MQEKNDHLSKKKTYRRHTPKEERLAHIKKWQGSGLSVSEYCRQHGIPLTSFLGWRRRATKSDQLFKPAAITSSVSAANAMTANVIEISAGPAVKLRLLNVHDVSLVVNLVRGLNKCS